MPLVILAIGILALFFLIVKVKLNSFLSLLLVVTTSMMGASRTLYQASVDGWLPRYLSRVSPHGVPVSAMRP